MSKVELGWFYPRSFTWIRYFRLRQGLGAGLRWAVLQRRGWSCRVEIERAGASMGYFFNAELIRGMSTPFSDRFSFFFKLFKNRMLFFDNSKKTYNFKRRSDKISLIGAGVVIPRLVVLTLWDGSCSNLLPRALLEIGATGSYFW